MAQKKNIFVVRHGHADFNAAIDFERDLTAKGIYAVKKTADFIKSTCLQLSLKIDLCISSAAARTQQTAKIICDHNGINNCQFYPELYSTQVSQWIDKIALENSQNIVIVGHNPTFSQLVNNLCDHEFYMQPANCAFISLEIRSDGIIYPATLNKTFQNE